MSALPTGIISLLCSCMSSGYSASTENTVHLERPQAPGNDSARWLWSRVWPDLVLGLVWFGVCMPGQEEEALHRP